ncbi:hypothetical protein JTE90_016666 [Oedothorax gibbosus]|uniref:THUMP domain-containing protein n=1 Tax=Oedothorax gibbosus TaxID=931172 RepID=A0AAV6V4Z9_9ARAC|nr:hypothetical protein JTE90_016666 [Oedothorax gibbosus]
MSDKQNKRKSKKKYYQSAKKQKTGVLETGLKGILITCNNEQKCVKESYNLLNEFADDLFGLENSKSNKDSESSDIDIEAELAAEIKDIQCNKRRFQQVCTMAKNVLFINTTVPDPTKLVSTIFEKVLETGQRKTRFILRMKPVVITCKPNQTDIRKHMDAYFEELTKDESNLSLSYKTDCTIRNNSSVTTSHIQWYVRETIEKYAPKWTVNLTDPQFVISVDILRGICCIGFLRNFVKFRKYNLSETAGVKEKALQISDDLKEAKESGDDLKETDESILSEEKINNNIEETKESDTSIKDAT